MSQERDMPPAVRSSLENSATFTAKEIEMLKRRIQEDEATLVAVQRTLATNRQALSAELAAQDQLRRALDGQVRLA